MRIRATGLAFCSFSLAPALSSPRFRRMLVTYPPLPPLFLYLARALLLSLETVRCMGACAPPRLGAYVSCTVSACGAFSDVLQTSIVTGAWLAEDSKLSRLEPTVEAEIAAFMQNRAPPVFVSFAGVAAVSRKMLRCVMLALQRLKFSAILDGILSYSFHSHTLRSWSVLVMSKIFDACVGFGIFFAQMTILSLLYWCAGDVEGIAADELDCCGAVPVLLVHNVPLAPILPKCCCVIHHGSPGLSRMPFLTASEERRSGGGVTEKREGCAGEDAETR